MSPLLSNVPDSPFELGTSSGARLVHLIPDELAKTVPEHILFSFGRNGNPQDGFVDVSSADLANAIDKAAWWLVTTLGHPHCFDSVAYIGPSDLRYFMFMFAAIKVGYKMLYLSVRNSLDGHLNVLETDGCQIILRARSMKVQAILERRKMRDFVSPELDEFLNCPPQTPYPYCKTFDEARMDPGLVLHTTGSTGLPKPVTWKVGIMSTYDAWRTIPAIAGCVPAPEIYKSARRAYSSLPLFHTSGLNAGIIFPLVLGVTLVISAPHVVPSAVYTDKMHQYARVDASMGAPSIYEDLSRDEAACKRINSLQYVIASGAPLSKRTGDVLSQNTRVLTQIGATEVACLQRLVPSKEDWEYYYWHPTHSGIEMRPIGDDLYELFIVYDPKLRLFQGVFTTFPNIEEWSMNDVYSRHPDPAKRHLWLYRGRKDDVIVLKNGEKLTPATMEALLMSSPYVDCAMIVGEHEFQPAALVEPAGGASLDSSQRRDFIKRIRPVLDAVNKLAPAHGQLDEHHLLLASPTKPIVRLGQGKIQRRQTKQLYEEEINQLFVAPEVRNMKELLPARLECPDFSALDTTMEWLRMLFTEFARIDDLPEDRDVFEAGTDSLHVINMARELKLHAKKAGLSPSAMAHLEPRAFYSNPTLSSLAAFLTNKMSPDPMCAPEVHGSEERTAEEEMEPVLHQLCTTLPRSATAPVPPAARDMTVLLTGSTGSLGSYLLDVLSHDSRVSSIICLNRTLNAAAKHANIGLARGLGRVDPGRVEFLHGDLSHQDFGLAKAHYEDLRQRVTHIIHNQWPVNFKYALGFFTPWLQGLCNLVQFSSTSAKKPFIFFISSVSAAGAWDSKTPVPEEPIHDSGAASDMGYARSKQLGERLLDKAAHIAGIGSACCRIGVIAGPVESVHGEWDRSHYVPSIFISSAHLGAFPSDFPSRNYVDWLPVDKTARIVFEQLIHCSSLSSSQLQHGTQLFHALNPSPVSWAHIATLATKLYPKDLKVQVVSFDKWLTLVSAASDDRDQDATQNPAKKLIDFYEGLQARNYAPTWQLDKSMRASRTLRDVKPINQGAVRNWMRQWGWIAEAANGFLPLN